MLSLFATLVFVIAGCTGAAVIIASLRSSLPALRRLAAERRALAQDRVYLFSVIETPPHNGEPVPVAGAVPSRIAAIGLVRRQPQTPLARWRAAA